MPEVNAGVRGVEVLTTENRRRRDVSPAVIQLEPDAGPLTTILMKLKSKKTNDFKFEWFEDQLLPRFDVLAGALGAADATMKMANFAYFRKGDLVQINHNEVVLVTATPTTEDVAIKRAFGEVAAVAVPINSTVQIVSNCFEDGSALSDILSTVRVPQYNYTQIMRNAFGFTIRNQKTDSFGGKDIEIEQGKQLLEQKKNIEYAIILGQRYIDATGTHNKSTTRGIQKWISSNVKDMGGEMTEDELEDFMRICFRYGNKKKLAIASPKSIQIINGFGREKLQTRVDESTYGVTMTQYKNAGKQIELIEHQLMNNDDLTDLTGLAGSGMILDIGDLSLRYMEGMMTFLQENVQTPGALERRDEYVSDIGLQLTQEKKHGFWFGATQ